MRNILFLLGCIIMTSCNRDFIYIDKTTEIIGGNMGECIEKKQASSESIGEWFICETYEFENNNKIIPTHNSLYANNTSWIKQDWQLLPIDSNSEINNIIFNFCGTARTKALSREMKKINTLGCGYYSFCVKPSLDDPRYIIFCMLDTTETKLYVVDAHI